MHRRGVAAVCALLAASPAVAHEYDAGDLTIVHPWARATPGRSPNGGAYLTVRNGGAKGDRLLGASAAVARSVEFHVHVIDGGIMKMRPVDAIAVPAGGEVALAPGGYHVMLIGLNAPLRQGETFPMTLTFERSGTVEVEVEVEAVGADGSGHATH